MCVSVPDSELKLDQRVRVLSGGRQLQITIAERTDTASYTCTASSEAGTTSKVYNLQVFGTYAPSDLRLILSNITEIISYLSYFIFYFYLLLLVMIR